MPPLSQDITLGFSSSLLETLRASRAKVDAFVESQNAAVDSQVIAHNERVSQEQALIDEQLRNLTTLKQERGLCSGNDNPIDGLAQRTDELFSQRNKLREKVNKLEDDRMKQQSELEDLQKQAAVHQSRAAHVREMKGKIEESKKTTVEDLTRGIVNYKYLGLDFEKAEGNRLRFTFTQLDAGEPSRAFSFQLYVTDDDIYQVDNCHPTIPASALSKMVDQLNKTDDLSGFVRKMRNAFSETV